MHVQLCSLSALCHTLNPAVTETEKRPPPHPSERKAEVKAGTSRDSVIASSAISS